MPTTSILLVDDNPAALKATARVLSRAGYEVMQAADGEEALRQVRAHPPGLVLLDVVMPGLSGTDVLRRIRADEQLASTPVLLHSALCTGPELEASGLAAGADGCITRPVSNNELLARVDAALNGRDPSPRRQAGVPEPRRLPDRLAEMTQRLEETQAVASVGSWETNLVDLTVAWTAETHRIFGTDPATFPPTHQGFLERVHPDDREAVEAAFVRSLDDTQVHAIRHRVVLDGGGLRMVEERWQVFPDEEGRPARAVGTCRDITEMSLAEARLNRSQTLARMAGRLASVGAWSITIPGRELEWSPEIYAILEVPLGELPPLDKTLEFYPPEWRPQVVKAIEACASDGTPFDLEVEILTARGRRIWVRAIGEAVRDSAGRITEVQGAFQDITERQREHLANERALRRLKDAQRIGQIGDWEWDLATQAVTWSPQVFEMTGRDPRLGPPRDYAETAALFEEESRKVMQDNMTRAMETGLVQEYELAMLRPDGTRVQFVARAVPVKDGAGQVRSLYGTIQDVTQARQAEQRARLAGDRLLVTLDSITDAFFTLNRDWCFSFLNAEAERLLRRTKDGLLGRNIWTEFPAAVGTDFQRHYETAMREETTVNFEAYYPAPLDTWFEVRAYHSDEGLAVYFQDITERRRNREAVRVSEERFRLLSKATNDVIWDRDLVTGEFWWSEGMATLFGYSPEEIEPTFDAWIRLIHPDDRDAVAAAVQQAVDGNAESWSGEYRFMAKDGGTAYVLNRSHIIRDASGNAVRMIGGMTDLTAHKQTEERLREQAALLDAAHEGILVKDIEDRIIYWNKGAERIYGWTAAEALGRKSKELFNTPPESFAAAHDRLLKDGEWSGELDKQARDGRSITVEVRWTLIRDEQGSPKSILTINSDITERKKLEKQFLRAQRMESIGTLAGGIAHDLNNLLAPITMGLGLLRTYVDQPKVQAVIDNMERSAQRGADLVRQVLSFARGVEGARVRIQVKHIIRELEKIMESTFPKSIRVTSRLGNDLWPVLGDPTQINQVVLNLCVNARDAMPEGGDLTLAVNNREFDDQYAAMNHAVGPGRYVVIEVTDTGCGIPPENLERIFDPFFTTKELGKGTGLGLSTVIGIVRSHGGFVNVYSEVGSGTTFKVCLPALTDEDAVDADAPGDQHLPRGNGEMILLVDDEVSILNITKHTLEAFGYRVITAEDGAQAIALYAVKGKEIAAVLTDMMMPVMDGPALIAALKRVNPSVRILASSGLNANGRVAKAVNAGVQHFIPKPYSAELLLQLLRKVLDEPIPYGPGNRSA